MFIEIEDYMVGWIVEVTNRDFVWDQVIEGVGHQLLSICTQILGPWLFQISLVLFSLMLSFKVIKYIYAMWLFPYMSTLKRILINLLTHRLLKISVMQV